LALRAVVFDYGMVLSGPQHHEAHQELRRITGLSHDDFERHYWADRLAYDRGDLTGITFWQKLGADAGLSLSPDDISLLDDWDARMWTTINPVMLAWHSQLKANGFRTAILSNMGDSVLKRMLAKFAWIEDFDVLIWSYQHRMVKPDPKIYRLLLDRLGTASEETLFLDDKLENIEGARRLGIQGIQFSTVEQLRQDLISAGLDDSLPLP
jgi:putative hydrolase of the HAD superfamily